MTSFLSEKYYSLLVKTLNRYTENIEFEIRFKKSKGKDLDFKEFYRVKSYLESVYGKTEVKRTEDFIQNDRNKDRNVNERLTLVNTHNNSYYTKILKTKIWDDVNKDINIKASVSTETEQEVNEPYKDWDVLRVKNRYTWDDTRRHIRFDITKVTQSTKEGDRTIYEVEMESIHPLFYNRDSMLSVEDMENLKTHLHIASQEMLKIVMQINDTDMPYTTSAKDDVANFINTTLNAKKYITNPKTFIKEGEMFEDIDTRARNLQFRDMVYGGLISKSNRTDKITDDPTRVGYSVTVKAEGLRKFLIIHSTGIWLVYRSEFCKICPLIESFKGLVNTVIDGEDIRDINNRKDYLDYSHYYLPFDTLVYKGKDVTNLTLKKRRELLNELFELSPVIYTNKKLLVLENKPFIYFQETSDSFYSAMKQIFNYKPSYVTDGLIFTPNNCIYNPLSQKSYDRVLNKTPDICKWKPLEELTMDLTYCISPSGRHLCYSDGYKKIPFKGDRFNPFDSETQVDWMHKLFEDLPLDTVVEFEPKMIHGKLFENNEGRYVLKPKRIRWDKQFANGKKVVDDVWKDIHDPITKCTLLGEDLRLVRKYHNKVKRRIFNDVIEGSNLIDIGSGYGGDIEKMKKFSKILCIEPNPDNLKKLIDERLPNASEDMKSKIHTLKAGGEESVKILKEIKSIFGEDIGKKPLYISFMLSLSFFWKDIKMLKDLIKTIDKIKEYYYENGGKDSVKILFLTIEGERALNLLKKYDYKIKNSAFNMSYDEESGEVSIDIKNTIVKEQTEYLVNLEELKELLNAKLMYIKDANEERFLSPIEKEFTSMYVYGNIEL
jgi:hypothetical protein